MRKHKFNFIFTVLIVAALLAGCSGKETFEETLEHAPGCVIPDIHNLTVEEAQHELEALGMKAVLEHEHNSEITAGHIISSDPEVGDHLEDCHISVTLIVSEGEEEEIQEAKNPYWQGWNSGTVTSILGGATLGLQIENHKYTWSLVDVSDSLMHYELAPQPVNVERYMLTVDVKRSAGEPGSAAGLLFNYEDEHNYFLFSVIDSGYYLLDQMKSGEWINLVEATKTEYTNKMQQNRLRMVVSGADYQFLINGYDVLTYSSLQAPHANNYVGLAMRVVDSSTVFEFEDFALDLSESALSNGSAQKQIYFFEDFESGQATYLISDSLGVGSGEFGVNEGKFVWELHTGSSCKYRAVASNYHIPENQKKFTIQTAIRQSGGAADECVAGILFNYDTTLGSYSFINISDLNNCSLNTYNAITRKAELIHTEKNCYVNYGEENHLHLDLTQHSLTLYVNDKQIFEHHDEHANYLEGEIALQVDCAEAGQTSYEFDGFEIFGLEE